VGGVPQVRREPNVAVIEAYDEVTRSGRARCFAAGASCDGAWLKALVLAWLPMIPETFRSEGDGVQITGDRWASEGPGGVVVLLHGGGQTRHSWDRTAARLTAAGSTAVTLDARGHGESDWDPDRDYSIDGFVGDLLTFVATLDRAPVLVGASLGGITSLVAAGEHPGLATGLVLVDVVVSVEQAGVDRIKSFLTAHHDGFASLEDVASAIEAYNPVRRRSRNLDGLRKNVRQRDDGRWYWHWDPEFISNDDEPQRRTDRQRLRRAASAITIPTLIVRGLQSDIVSDAGVADMQRLIPEARIVEVPQAGHMVAGDDNDVFANRLVEFLSSLDPG
jgi:pimeloyl-ACP methyl ester carboxylesterase